MTVIFGRRGGNSRKKEVTKEKNLYPVLLLPLTCCKYSRCQLPLPQNRLLCILPFLLHLRTVLFSHIWKHLSYHLLSSELAIWYIDTILLDTEQRHLALWITRPIPSQYNSFKSLPTLWMSNSCLTQCWLSTLSFRVLWRKIKQDNACKVACWLFVFK
jgi:hypothetical protein